jgi:succinate dehydrogenase hydrophobic anchor subunit
MVIIHIGMGCSVIQEDLHGEKRLKRAHELSAFFSFSVFFSYFIIVFTLMIFCFFSHGELYLKLSELSLQIVFLFLLSGFPFFLFLSVFLKYVFHNWV